MLRIYASYCTDFLMRHINISSTRRQVYLYGFELILSTLVSVLSILLISTLISGTWDGVIFLMIFIGLRMFCGGYHAKTYERCFVSFNFTFLMTWALAKSLIYFDLRISAMVLVIISTITILILAPVQNKKHPLSDQRYKKNQKVAIFLIVILFIVYFALNFFSCSFRLLAIFSSSISAVAILMVIPILSERRKLHG